MLANAGFEQNIPWWWAGVLVGAAVLATAIYFAVARRQDRYKDNGF